ncbi:WD40/YVTN/BNR-like repeat-containing protein [Abyssalbus ytuae]|uniref:Oxidoreductase n=1 Tax=Abyssalbus ytuae TaxID=2926907 RepID=A0A9E6ZN44_9FLAO|nr:oxidoreductase [Abyssalbus ytuae]UOB18917.1 oxidoreductase [Abyssalbus ytuae]
MKKIIIFFSLVCCSWLVTSQQGKGFSTVKIDTICVLDGSVRAIGIDKDKKLWFAAENGEIGFYNGEKGIKTKKLAHGPKQPNFRSIAFSGNHTFVLSIGNPALLFKIDDNLRGIDKTVYRENHEKVFYDSMAFWNEKEGIAMGDPTENCLSVIITRDGGETWKKIPCENLPLTEESEAAFAASNTNIALKGDKTWLVTGGGKSRVFFSPDKGLTWQVFNTPIGEGGSHGIYSVDFYDENTGIVFGGNYSKPDENKANKAITFNGGYTWELVADKTQPGYRSCVQYVPNSEGKEIVAIGFKGISYSNDRGRNWKQLSDEGFYTIKFIDNTTAYAAGKGRIAKLTFIN